MTDELNKRCNKVRLQEREGAELLADASILYHESVDLVHAMQKENQALRAENERLREALKDLVEAFVDVNDGIGGEWQYELEQAP